MKLKKSFSFTDKNQIWRIVISDSDKILIETRDTDNKEVFFNYIDLKNGKAIFKNLQLDEKYWIGVEKIYKDYIIFHQYAKPNMPEHKKIIVYDVLKNEILWKNEDYIFLTIIDDKIYAYKKKFDGRDIFVLDFYSGEIIKELTSEETKINSILQNLNTEDFSNYLYPQTLSELDDKNIRDFINNDIIKNENVLNIDKLIYDDLLIVNYHVQDQNNFLDNKFAVYNIAKKKKLIAETINKNLNSFSPDSFFCYKNNLIVLKHKVELTNYKIV